MPEIINRAKDMIAGLTAGAIIAGGTTGACFITQDINLTHAGAKPLAITAQYLQSELADTPLPLDLAPHLLLEGATGADIHSDSALVVKEAWLKYLNNLPELAPTVGRKLATQALQVWNSLDDLCSRSLFAPQAGPTEDMSIQMVWDLGKHHLEVEVFENGYSDWFYRDRAANTYTGGEDLPQNKLLKEIKDKLFLFV